MYPGFRPETPEPEGVGAGEESPLARYRVELYWSEPDERFVANAPQFGRGVRALGSSPREALAELELLLDALEERYREEGRPLPKGPGYSGQLRLRLPRSLHAALAGAARREGVSLNTLLVSYLSERAGDESVFRELRERFDESASPQDYRRSKAG